MGTRTTATELSAALRSVADFVEANPDLDWSYVNADVTAITLRPEGIAAAAAVPGGWEKKAYDNPRTGTGNFEIRREFGPVLFKIIAPREEVCERKVVGVETVEVPDPDAPKVVVEREVVEWECRPLLTEAKA
jgi:hypothetical protein